MYSLSAAKNGKKIPIKIPKVSLFMWKKYQEIQLLSFLNVRKTITVACGTIYSIPGLAYTVLSAEALAKVIIMHVSLKHGSRIVLTQDVKLQ